MEQNFTLSDKSIIYTEDIRSSINSLRDALEFIQSKSVHDQYAKNYSNNLTLINSKFENKEIKVDNSKGKLLSEMKSTDVLLKQSKLVVSTISEILKKKDLYKSFQELNTDLNSVIAKKI